MTLNQIMPDNDPTTQATFLAVSEVIQMRGAGPGVNVFHRILAASLAMSKNPLHQCPGCKGFFGIPFASVRDDKNMNE